MKRLLEGQGKNSSKEYDEIFHERAKSEPNWQDVRRWKELVRYYRDGFIVDLGVLDSKICEFIPNKDKYVGIDLAEDAVKQMFQRYGGSVSFAVGDLYETDIKNDAVSYVVMGEVLEHLEGPEKAVKEAFRILKPGGVLAISVPLNEAIEPGACDADRHLWSYDKNDLKNLVGQYSSKIKFKVLGSKWFPYRYCFPQLLCWATKE